MTETTFEMLSDIAYLYKIILRIVLFLVLWKVFYPMKFKESMLQIWKEKELLMVVFLNVLYWNLHSISFLTANSIYQVIETNLMYGYEVETLLDMDYVYKSMAIGLGIMFVIYTLAFFSMILGIKKVRVKQSSINWIEGIFLSVLNIVGWMFAQMIGKIMVVKINTEVFLLFDERTEFLWWVPLMAILLYFGELAVIYSHQKYVEKQKEQELLFIENQQIKVLKQRLEDVESFYGNIRKVRHEMRNHMMNIKGLVSNAEYDEVKNYIHELDATIQTLEYKYSTGNPVIDVLINDKWRRSEKLGIRFEVEFYYNSSILVYDMAIILNNLLDNAIEACEKIAIEDRYVKVKFKRKHRFVLVEVENAFDGMIRWENHGTFPATRKHSSMEHGIGLKNVKDVANRYYGDLDIKVQENIFKVTVLLQEKEEKNDANYNTND